MVEISLPYTLKLILNIPNSPSHSVLNVVLMLLFLNHKPHVLVMLCYGVLGEVCEDAALKQHDILHCSSDYNLLYLPHLSQKPQVENTLFLGDYRLTPLDRTQREKRKMKSGTQKRSWTRQCNMPLIARCAPREPKEDNFPQTDSGCFSLCRGCTMQNTTFGS